MERPIWILALTLAGITGLGCKDSNQNYIAFDAAQATDTRSDTPAPDAVHGTPADASADGVTALEDGRDSAADLIVADAVVADADGAEASTPDGAALDDAEQGQ
jgi:hypothetical protein